jgi:subtilisin-like proprotein convertase family protein
MKHTYLKNQIVMGLTVLTLTVSATMKVRGAISFINNGGGDYIASSSTSQVIPDNDPSGVAYSLVFNDSGLSVANVSVNFTTSGGYNGDLYAYLENPNGTLVTLLNHVGTGLGSGMQYTYGFSTSGFNNVTLTDAGNSGFIHAAQTPGSISSGVSYKPDGGTLSSFNGANPNGDWTLFFADTSGGSISTLNGFTVDVTAVPEPVNVALGIFGGLLATMVLGKKLKLGFGR